MMNWRQMRTALLDRRKLLELSAGAFVLVLMAAVGFSRSLDNFENLFLDMRFQLRGQRAFPPGITLVGVDEASITRNREFSSASECAIGVACYPYEVRQQERAGDTERQQHPWREQSPPKRRNHQSGGQQRDSEQNEIVLCQSAQGEANA